MPKYDINGACLQGRTGISERPTEPSADGAGAPEQKMAEVISELSPSIDGAGAPEQKTAEVISGMSPEQQKQLSQIYYFLVQVPLPSFSHEIYTPANSSLALYAV